MRGAVLAAALAAALMLGGAALAHHSDLHNYLLSWIPASCCVTNDCCWEIQSSEVQPLPNDRWLIRASGQVVTRTAWSPDGKYWRCACDPGPGVGQWTRHDKARTNCLFVPAQMF